DRRDSAGDARHAAYLGQRAVPLPRCGGESVAWPGHSGCAARWMDSEGRGRLPVHAEEGGTDRRSDRWEDARGWVAAEGRRQKRGRATRAAELDTRPDAEGHRTQQVSG